MDSFLSSTNHILFSASAFQSCAILTSLNPGGSFNTSLNFGVFNEFMVLQASCKLQDNITCPLVINAGQTQVIQNSNVVSLDGRCISSFNNETTTSVVITASSPNLQFKISCYGSMPLASISEADVCSPSS